jgi:hypothetical protein
MSGHAAVRAVVPADVHPSAGGILQTRPLRRFRHSASLFPVSGSAMVLANSTNRSSESLHRCVVDRQDALERNSAVVSVHHYVHLVELHGFDHTLAVSQHCEHLDADVRQVLIAEHQGAKGSQTIVPPIL